MSRPYDVLSYEFFASRVKLDALIEARATSWSDEPASAPSSGEFAPSDETTAVPGSSGKSPSRKKTSESTMETVTKPSKAISRG